MGTTAATDVPEAIRHNGVKTMREREKERRRSLPLNEAT